MTSVPDVPCCDICDPSLFDRTRPGTAPTTARAKNLKKGQPDLRAKAALREWRDLVFERDHQHAHYDETAILDDELIATIVCTGGTPPSQLRSLLVDKWIFFDRHGEELLNLVSSLKIVFTPLPTKPRATQKPPSVPPTPTVAPASLKSHDASSSKRMLHDLSEPPPDSHIKRPRLGLGPAGHGVPAAPPTPQRTPYQQQHFPTLTPSRLSHTQPPIANHSQAPAASPRYFEPPQSAHPNFTPSRTHAAPYYLGRSNSTAPHAFAAPFPAHSSYPPPPAAGPSTAALSHAQRHGMIASQPSAMSPPAHHGLRASTPVVSTAPAFTFTPPPSQLHATYSRYHGLQRPPQQAPIPADSDTSVRQLPRTHYAQFDALPRQGQPLQLDSPHQRPYSRSPASHHQTSYSAPIAALPPPAGLYPVPPDTPASLQGVHMSTPSAQHSGLHIEATRTPLPVLPPLEYPPSPVPSQTYYDPFSYQDTYQ